MNFLRLTCGRKYVDFCECEVKFMILYFKQELLQIILYLVPSIRWDHDDFQDNSFHRVEVLSDFWMRLSVPSIYSTWTKILKNTDIVCCLWSQGQTCRNGVTSWTLQWSGTCHDTCSTSGKLQRQGRIWTPRCLQRAADSAWPFFFKGKSIPFIHTPGIQGLTLISEELWQAVRKPLTPDHF